MKEELVEVMNYYSLEEHTHRFAVWAAARASQRGFTTTSKIQSAIEAVNLREKLVNFESSSQSFDELHKEICTGLMSYFETHLQSRNTKINEKDDKDLFASFDQKGTYGKCAKIIAIYIKVAYVIPNSKCQLAKIAHPPIDRILLTALQKSGGCKFNKINWTNFSKDDYFLTIQEIRKIQKGVDFWKIEVLWNPAKTDQE